MVGKSDHVRSRWHERTPKRARTLMWAWEHGTPVDYVTPFFTDEDGNEADEVRLYHAVTETGTEYAMVLIRCDTTLVTTYPYDGVSDPRVEAYLDEMYEATIVYE